MRKSSQRESKVFRMMLQGLTDKEIALEFGVSLATISQYTKAIIRKSGARTRVQAVARILTAVAEATFN